MLKKNSLQRIYKVFRGEVNAIKIEFFCFSTTQLIKLFEK